MSELDTYKKKRDFSKTTEPKGSKKVKGDNIFVIQKHDASRLHYDFRLQIGNVLASWAVPKGPSLNPSDKRLAVMTEDHPLDYAEFEGVIPEGQYGAGPVMIWDKGTYTNIKEEDGKKVPMKKCLEDGQIEVKLDGEKLKGNFALVRFKDSEKNWLLVKMNDEYASEKKNPVNTQKKSVLTNRTMAQIKKDAQKEND